MTITALDFGPRPWWHEAACAGAPVDMFFPERGSNAQEAIAICGDCLVREECLLDALATETRNHTYGVRGGIAARDRSRMRRDKQRCDECRRPFDVDDSRVVYCGDGCRDTARARIKRASRQRTAS